MVSFLLFTERNVWDYYLWLRESCATSLFFFSEIFVIFYLVRFDQLKVQNITWWWLKKRTDNYKDRNNDVAVASCRATCVYDSPRVPSIISTLLKKVWAIKSKMWDRFSNRSCTFLISSPQNAFIILFFLSNRVIARERY